MACCVLRLLSMSLQLFFLCERYPARRIIPIRLSVVCIWIPTINQLLTAYSIQAIQVHTTHNNVQKAQAPIYHLHANAPLPSPFSTPRTKRQQGILKSKYASRLIIDKPQANYRVPTPFLMINVLEPRLSGTALFHNEHFARLAMAWLGQGLTCFIRGTCGDDLWLAVIWSAGGYIGVLRGFRSDHLGAWRASCVLGSSDCWVGGVVGAWMC